MTLIHRAPLQGTGALAALTAIMTAAFASTSVAAAAEDAAAGIRSRFLVAGAYSSN
jgi:hypothetical protein